MCSTYYKWDRPRRIIFRNRAFRSIRGSPRGSSLQGDTRPINKRLGFPVCLPALFPSGNTRPRSKQLKALGFFLARVVHSRVVQVFMKRKTG
jgi:hypothetical protein